MRFNLFCLRGLFTESIGIESLRCFLLSTENLLMGLEDMPLIQGVDAATHPRSPHSRGELLSYFTVFSASFQHSCPLLPPVSLPPFPRVLPHSRLCHPLAFPGARVQPVNMSDLNELTNHVAFSLNLIL